MENKISIYNSRTYNITVTEYQNGTVYAEVRTKHLYKHRVHRYKKTHRKWHSISKRTDPSHCLIDYVKDYIDYYDCLDRLKHSKCARRWFITILKPYVEKFF